MSAVQVFGRGMTRGASHRGDRRPKSAKAPSRGRFGARPADLYKDLMFAPVMKLDEMRAQGDLDGVRKKAWKGATGIRGVAWSDVILRCCKANSLEKDIPDGDFDVD
jgi:hypothetical protein